MFNWLGGLVSRFWGVVILAWLALAIALQFTAPKWDDVANDGDLVYLPARMTSVRGEQKLKHYFPGPPPELDVSDIDAWKPLAEKLLAGAAAQEPSPSKRIAELLPADALNAARDIAQSTDDPTDEQQEALLAGLNSLLPRRDLYETEAFGSLPLPDDLKHAFRSYAETPPRTDEQLRRSNRRLIDATYPDSIVAGPWGNSKSQVVLVFEREDGPIEISPDDKYLAVINQFKEHFKPENAGSLPIVMQWNYETEVVGEKLRTPDKHAMLLVLGLSTEFMAVKNKDVLQAVRDEVTRVKAQSDFPEDLKIGITGSAAIGGDMIASAAESIKNTENTTVILVLIILLIVYRAPLLVVIPLTTIITSVFVATRLVAILALNSPLEIFSTSKVFIIVILFGAGTDFCLFLISRYREELEEGRERGPAVANSVGNVGGALAASAFTTIFGLAVMFFADFGKYTHSGPTIGLCLTVALLACMTLAPALLRASGKWVFWPFGQPGQQKEAKESSISKWMQRSIFGNFWESSSRKILAYPGRILTISLLIMIVLAVPGWDVDVTHDLLTELPTSSTSVQGTKLLREHYAAGDTGPVTVLAYRNPKDEPADVAGLDTKPGEMQIKHLSETLARLDRFDLLISRPGPDGKPVFDDKTSVINIKSENRKLTALASLPAGKEHCFYLGADIPFDGISLQLSQPNTAAAQLRGSYFDGKAWQPLPRFEDTTSRRIDGHDTTLAEKGHLFFQAPSDWAQNEPDGNPKHRRYWTRFEVTAPLAADLVIDNFRMSLGNKFRHAGYEGGIRDVRSLAYPLGGVPVPGQRWGLRETAKNNSIVRHPKTRLHYLSTVKGMRGVITRLEVVLSCDPFSKEAMAWLGKLDAQLEQLSKDPESPWYRGPYTDEEAKKFRTEFDLVGVTAGIRDLEAVTTSDRLRIQPLVVFAVLGVLLVLLEQKRVSLFVMFTVVLSYLVTMGVTFHLFAYVYGDSFTGLDWKVPLFLFVILVAVGMDYNIYLITRVAEETRRRGPFEGIRVAVVQTGGIITSCGIIMAGTFVSMMTGTLRGMMELGFALSFGVLLDTLFIRTVLVPAFLVLLARWDERHQKEPQSGEAESQSPAASANGSENGAESKIATPHSLARSQQRAGG